MQGHDRMSIRRRDVTLQSTQVVGEDRIICRQGNRTLQGLGIHQLLLPPQLADPLADVHLDPELAHDVTRRSQMELSGGIVTRALAGKWPHGSGEATTRPRLPNSPDPS